MAHTRRQPTRSESFGYGEARYREILLEDRTLVGSFSVGVWDDLPALYTNVYQMPELSERAVERFRQTGRLDVSTRPLAGEGNLCECMQVKRLRIPETDTRGAELAGDLEKTGAGTVCGGCRPRIIELTGGNAWTSVSGIVNIREHNETIRRLRISASARPVLRLQGGTTYRPRRKYRRPLGRSLVHIDRGG